MADWIDSLLALLRRQPATGYRSGGAPASEPTALAAMALLAHDQLKASLPALDWLRERQAADGSVGVRADESTPCWPTALAVIVWQQACEQGQTAYAPCARRGRDWLLSMCGQAIERNPNMGHDSTIVGWPWVDGTHSWLEPTAWSVLALQATGDQHHPRARDGRRLIADRLLIDGGCNYGNTIVLGQPLRAHVQPSGLALWALAGEDDRDGRILATIEWLLRDVNHQTTATSLAYATIGLAAHDRAPAEAESWLRDSFQSMKPASTSGLKLALVGLATAACRRDTAIFSFLESAL
jgi:hypothetical protein